MCFTVFFSAYMCVSAALITVCALIHSYVDMFTYVASTMCANVCVYQDTFCSYADRLNSLINTLTPSPTSRTPTEHTLVLSYVHSPTSHTCLSPQVGAVWFLRLLRSVQLLCLKIKGFRPEEGKNDFDNYTRVIILQ